jgi:hypothetical protein
VQYTLKRYKTAKHVRIRVYGEEVIVTAPKRLSRRWIDDFVYSRAEWVVEEQRKSRGGGDITATSKEHYDKHREQSLKLTKGLVESWSICMNADPKKVSVRRVRSRWGSCSKDGNLSFSYKILFLPKDLQDYLVVHELAHLFEMNHSPSFWRIVDSYVPNGKQKQKRLRSLC